MADSESEKPDKYSYADVYKPDGSFAHKVITFS